MSEGGAHAIILCIMGIAKCDTPDLDPDLHSPCSKGVTSDCGFGHVTLDMYA